MSTSPQELWLPETRELFLKLEAEKGWTQMMRTDMDQQTADYDTFSGIQGVHGRAFHFGLFLNPKEGKLRAVCQFSEDTNGFLKEYVHAGAIATVHDGINAAIVTNLGTRLVFTACIHIKYITPVPVKSAILMEAKIEKKEGKKLFLVTSFKSPDETTVYSTSESLWIVPKNSKL